MTTDTATTTAQPAAGTWQETLTKSASLFERSGKARKQASSLLWTGAQAAIEEWIPESHTDASGENLGAEVLSLLGKSRKGDASKIKTVALAVKDHGLLLPAWPNLSKAYSEATRLTKTVKTQQAEDTAADETVAAIADAAPKSSSTPEGAALIVLSKGVDEAARLLLDALNNGGADNPAVHRAFLRAISQEIAGRVPKPTPKPKAAPKPKAGATKAKPGNGAAKAKPASGKAKPKPNPKADRVPVKAEVVDSGDKPEVTEPTIEGDADMFDAIEGDEVEAVETPEVPAKKKATPVVRRR